MTYPEGIYAAMMTPFTETGSVNLTEVRRMTEFMIQGGVQGLFPVSNVGEHIQLDLRQKQCVVEAVVEQAAGRVRVFPGISSAGTRQAAEFGQFCKEAGADGVVLSAPFYFPYPPDVVCDGLEAVVCQVDLPVVLYNIPLYANAISPDMIRRLLRYDVVVAMKDSSGSVPALLEYVDIAREMRPSFRVLVGWEEMLVSAMAVGASGCMTASGGIFPEIMAALYRSIQEGRRERAAALQNLIAKATKRMKQVFFPYGYKLAMQARGFSMGHYAVAFDESRILGEQRDIETMVEEVLTEFKGLERR